MLRTAMLEPVALNQTRFNTPGVAPDPRGILLGKLGAVLFSSVDRLVGFFRVYTDESSMDDLYGKLRILQVRSPLETREHLVLFHATSSHLIDRVARQARLFGGLTFTGSNKHFVKYRDDTSPLGYDISELQTSDAEVVLYADSFSQPYARVKEVAFGDLVLRLSLRRLPGGIDPSLTEANPGSPQTLWLAVQPGLARHLLVYLWRNGVRAEAAMADPEKRGGAFAETRSVWLIRVQDLPLRMRTLFLTVPGIEVHRQVTDNCLAQIGWRHPLRLESCGAVFEKDKLYVFSGERDAVDVLRALPSLAPASDLVGTGFDLAERSEPRPLEQRAPGETPRVEVTLRLVPSPVERSQRRVTAALVPWGQAEWLRRLVYLLPPAQLAGCKVAAIPEGLFVLSDGGAGVDALPLGELYTEAARAIYVPLGWEILPRVAASVLDDQVGGTQGRAVVFLRGADRPVALEDALFEPLARRALARMVADPRERDLRLPPPRALTPATVVNEEAGSLPLWGWTDKAPEK
jgi:hypothetical protein